MKLVLAQQFYFVTKYTVTGSNVQKQGFLVEASAEYHQAKKEVAFSSYPLLLGWLLSLDVDKHCGPPGKELREKMKEFSMRLFPAKQAYEFAQTFQGNFCSPLVQPEHGSTSSLPTFAHHHYPLCRARTRNFTAPLFPVSRVAKICS